MGKPTKETAHIIKQLGILNESRGTDSTGLAIIHNTGFELYKKAVNSTTFFNDLEKTNKVAMYRKLSFLTIMGHTRMATRGAVTDENAHPFAYKDTVFSHNGIISNFDELQATHKTDFQVDSEIIGHLLEEKDYHKAFKSLAGMFAIPYVRMQQPNMLNVAIHSQVFSFAYKGDQLYYSSEFRHLQKALHGKGFAICTTGDNKLYRFYVIQNKGIAISREKIEAKPYVYTPYSYGYEYENWRPIHNTSQSGKPYRKWDWHNQQWMD